MHDQRVTVADRPNEDAYVSQKLTKRGRFEADVDHYLGLVGRFRQVDTTTRILEIGAGIGWFEVFCGLRGLHCEGIEHNPVNIAAATRLGAEYGITPIIHEADAVRWDYGHAAWDVIFAASVFEHIRDYRPVLAKVYDALTPGGVFYFYSTNKWSLRSGEFPGFPLYGWLPYTGRERIRVRAGRGSRAIVDSGGIDFNQFTYWGLKRDLRRAGFSTILDHVDLLQPDSLREPTTAKLMLARAVKAYRPMRLLARTFAHGNVALCIKT